MAISFRAPAGQRTAQWSAASAPGCEVCGQHALSTVNPDRHGPPAADGRLFCLVCGAHQLP